MMAIIINVIMGSVILLMLGAGLNIEFRQVIDLFKRFRLVMLGVLANFLVVPLLTVLCLTWVPLYPDIKIGIILMAAAPIAPMAPVPFVEKAKGDVVYSVGLMVIVAVLSIALTPLILSLSIPESVGGVTLNPLSIVKTLLMVQLIPITIGMIMRKVRPSWADKLVKIVPRIGQIGLLIGVGLLLAKQASQIISIDISAYLIMILLAVIFLFVGDWILIGETADKRRSLAVSTAIRNVPLAFLIATENFPDSISGAVVLVFSVFTMVLSVVYGKFMSNPESNN
jgi:BASS family bile acid:Na+ symporter